MAVGIWGVGAFISSKPIITNVLAIFGALFLILYGFNAFKSAIQGNSTMQVDSTQQQKNALTKIILSTLAVTLLNSHVYLDTVVIVDGIAGT